MTTEKHAPDAALNGEHDHCLICGYRNPWSLGIQFSPEVDGAVRGRFQGHPRLQGYRGRLHGGVVAALLDSAMVHCLFQQGIQGVTGDLHVRFLQPVPFDAVLDVRAHVVSAAPPLYYLKAELVLQKRTMAWGEATFMDCEREVR